MRRWAVTVLLLAVAACGDADPGRATREKTTAEPPVPESTAADTGAPSGARQDSSIPDHVIYDEILIAFKDSFKDAQVDRPKEAAGDLARRVFAMARAGTDFRVLKEEYTDLRPNGDPSAPTRVARDGVERATNEIYRSTLYAGVSEVLYGLDIDDVGLVEHDPKRFPAGWLIIKRLG